MSAEAHFTVLADPESLAVRVADWILERALTQPGRVGICLSGGSTPERLYRLLAQRPYYDRMPWQRIHWFWGDERFVSSKDPRSNYRMVRKALLARADPPLDHVHPIPTEEPTLDAAVVKYERELQRFYGGDELSATRPLFDVTLLGLGVDGHTASLLPGSSVLEERSRWVAAVIGSGAETRITLTYPALESSRDVAFLVSGAAKREILGRIRAGARDVPAARLRPVGRLHWFVDRAADGDRC